MLKREDIGRNQPVRGRHPAFGIGVAIVGDDQVEIEHQPVEFALAKTTAIEEHRTRAARIVGRSEEHTSELQSLMRISYAVFCLKKKKHNIIIQKPSTENRSDQT